MSNLFFRALSQGLQAFLPVASALIWCRALAARNVSAAVKAGLLASIPLSIAGAWLFRTTTHQALVEASLAFAAIGITIAGLYVGPVFRPGGAAAAGLKTGPTYVIAIAAMLIVVRQTMEIVAVFEAAAFEVRSFDATLAVVGGSVLAVLLSWAAVVVAARWPARARLSAVRTFSIAFLAQTVLYAFHESAEARLLP